MLSYVLSFFQRTPQPCPPPVTIIGARFPTDGSAPHLLALTTTTEGVAEGPDCFLFHIPTGIACLLESPAGLAVGTGIWSKFTLTNQPIKACEGVYQKFFSFALDDLPRNAFLPPLFSREHGGCGGVFVVKLAKQDQEHEWAVYENILPKFLDLPVTQREATCHFSASF